MNTKYEEIVSVGSIGREENPIKNNEILAKAVLEKLKPAEKDVKQIALLCIDVQQDFMDGGELGVPGAIGDVERITRFIYDNMENITRIYCSLDTHNPFQIFHPSWWVDADGKNAPPFTAITLADIDAGKWFAVIDPVHSREYVEKLETNGKKTLVVWPYHCLQGTRGQALENQFSNMVKFYEVARKSHVVNLIKGNDPLSEMYGIIKPEYDRKNFINIDLLNKLESFDKIIICGEAKSHCVLESIKQILEYYSGRPEITKKVYILEDCMSVIPSFEDSTRDAYAEFTTKYKVNIIKSTEMKF